MKSQEEWTTYFGDSDGTTNHRTVSYTYDADGNRLTKALPATTTHAYSYTNRNQISSLLAGVGGASMVDYTYDKNGNIVTRSPNNSTSSSFVYDAVNRVTKITHNFVGATRVLNYAYTPVGNRQYEHRDNNLGNDDFGYDLNSQLTNFARSLTLTGNTNSAFTFDASGNRSKLVKDAATTNYTINNLNEYATITGAAAPTYDDNGNVLTYDDGTAVTTFTYDSMNRLTQAVKSGTTEKFYYDGLNRQIARSITGGATVITVWDGWNVYAEFAAGGTTRTDLLLYGPGNDLVKSTALGQFFYPDALGSTAHYANASGTLLESYTYDLYGQPHAYVPSTGAERIGGTIYGMTRLYTGQQWHAATGIYDNRNRFLSPSLGRFLQPDPIGFAGDPSNLYRYVGNNPVNWSDPDGLNPFFGNKIMGTSWAVRWYSSYASTAHQFVYTTNSDGSLAHTYTWGSEKGNPFLGQGGLIKGGWQRDTDDATNIAAQTLISRGGGQPIGSDSSLDPFIDAAYKVLKKEPPHFNGDLWPPANVADCQGEAQRLIQLAQQLQTQALKQVLKDASYRDINGNIYDANGRLIANASELFQFDSANVSGVAPAGIMSVSWPSAQMPSGIQP